MFSFVYKYINIYYVHTYRCGIAAAVYFVYICIYLYTYIYIYMYIMYIIHKYRYVHKYTYVHT